MNGSGVILVIYIILFLFIAILISWFVAREFFHIARDKGYKSKKYFWICFLLGFVGWIMVCAMPDRGQGQTVVTNDELPEL